jgi:hypothetical protein
MFKFIKKHRQALKENTEAILILAKAIRLLAGPPAGIGPLSLEVYGENDMLLARVKLPSIPEGTPEGEVISGQVTLTVNGVEQTIETVPGQEYLEGLTFNEGDKVSGSFSFVDNNGNISTTPKTFDEVEIKDTFAVEPTGDFGLEVTGETA